MAINVTFEFLIAGLLSVSLIAVPIKICSTPAFGLDAKAGVLQKFFPSFDFSINALINEGITISDR